jgi:hypothetical protein
MSRTNRMRPLALFVIASLNASAQLRPSDQNELLDRASHAYYNLKDAGLLEFRCRVLPDWDAIYANLNVDAAGRELLPLVKQTRFDVLVGPTGASTVSRHSDAAPPNEQLAERLRTTVTGVEQMLTGFWGVWSQFMYGVPGPDRRREFTTQEVDGEYRITQKEGQVDILLTMNSDLALTEVRTTTGDIVVTVRPKLSHLPGGYLFSGYGTTYFKKGSGPVASQVLIENRDVEGFQLPVQVIGVMGGVRVPLTFSAYQIKKRQ